MLVVNKEIKILSDRIARKSILEAEHHPTDRYFLNPYVQDILKLDRNSFLLYNLEGVNNTYTEYLLLCLPELWVDITIDDLIEIINNFTNLFSYYAIILFTYKYIEVDIIELILNLKMLSNHIKPSIKDYLKSQYPNLLKNDGEIFIIDEDMIGVKNNDWMYIKQKLLLDKRVKPALQSIEELEIYIRTF